jgi:DNA polymerase/3'-5' exonuclease PolX
MLVVFVMNKSKCGGWRLFTTTPPKSSVFPYSLQVSKKAKDTRQVAFILNNTVDISVVEPEPQGAGTFGRSRSWSWNVEVSAPAPGSGSAQVVNKN